MQNSLREHYEQAEAIVADRHEEMNQNLARIATDKSLRDANDLIQKQRGDILDLQDALSKIDALENALGQLCLLLQERIELDPSPVMSLMVATKENSQ